MIPEKKPIQFNSPDLAKKQEVVIDFKTRIYVALGADPEEARKRFITRFGYQTS
jgi:hypothetical protein